MGEMQCYKYDVIVIGGGGAGSMAAIRAAKAGTKVALIEKGVHGRNGCTVLGGFSACAALGYAVPRDNPEVHFLDTMRAGQYIGNPKLVSVYTENAPRIVHEVASYGVNWNREKDGRFSQAMMPGHTYPRAVFVQRHTGRAIQRAVRSEVLKQGVDVYEDTIVLDLLKYENKVVGALCCRLNTTQPVLFLSKTVVVATGGCGQLYSRTTTSEDNTGDGLVLAWKAGAELMDLEFVQFYPTVQCYPKMPGMGPCAPAFIRIRGGARLYNSQGEDFVEKRMPNWRFKATRDFLARAIYHEIQEGRGTPHGGVYMRVSHLMPEEIEEVFSLGNYFNKMLKHGIDLRKDVIETTVANHFHMGGIRIDSDCCTSVEGLLACGEAAAGIHGANRLGGNALTEILVFGSIAGETAARNASKFNHPPISKVHQLANERFQGCISVLKRDEGVRPRVLKQRLQKIMWDNVGVIRNGTDLKYALGEIQKVLDEAKNNAALQFKGSNYNKELVDYWEVLNMTELGYLIALAAHSREESRGSHWRDDFPSDNDAWITNLVTEPGKAVFRKVSAPGAQLKQ